MEGFLVVRRIDWFKDLPLEDPVPRIPDRKPALGLETERVQSMYRGIDGVPWPEAPNLQKPPLHHGVAGPDSYDSVLSNYHPHSNCTSAISYMCKFLLKTRASPERQ